MYYDGYNRGRARAQTSYIIPAWKKGDHVRHKLTSLTATVEGLETEGGELVKLKLDVVPERNASFASLGGRRGRFCVAHAADLEIIV